MTCEKCMYLDWRLSDLLLSLRKNPSPGLQEDIDRMVGAIRKHRKQAHFEFPA